MITNLLEFYFSKHYFYDSDNRFKLRIKDAVILNELSQMDLAKTRFKQVLSYIGLTKLDNLSIQKYKAFGIVFGNLFFREHSKLIKANIQVDKSEGNIYVAIIKNETVVTILLLPDFMTNQDILEKCNKEANNAQLETLIDISGNKLDMDSKKRPSLIIDLDIEYKEFNSQYPVILKNNQWSSNVFSDIEIGDFKKNAFDIEKTQKDNKVILSGQVIPEDVKKFIPEKEFVIYVGKKIFVPYPDGIKEKVIKKLIINEKGDKREFSLEFENTLKPMKLDIGTQFIITPNFNNDALDKLVKSFNLESENDLSFQGPITKFSYYSKAKTKSIEKLGIFINSRLFLNTGSK
jgi:hypothetical protein